VKAIQANEDDHSEIASLHRATYGMLLFGIPHKGLVVDDIQKIVAGQDNHPGSVLLEQIRSKSNVLAFQLVDFRNLIQDRKVVSFYDIDQTRQLEFV
jgi:protein SERAC1